VGADGSGATETDRDGGALDVAQRAMQTALLRRAVALVTAGAMGLLVRELLVGSPALPALLGVLLGLAALAWSRAERAPLPVVGFVFYCAVAALITLAALDMGGAAGSALSFAFLPGFLAVLTLGPALGYSVCAVMLACFAWLVATTELPAQDDLLRFVDEVAMTVFAAGLAHALHRGFVACKAAFEARQQLLLALRDQRETLTKAIYDELEPLSARLVLALDTRASHSGERETPAPLLEQLLETLRRAKVLGNRDPAEELAYDQPDLVIRMRTMRIWLRMAIVLESFFLLRNLLSGSPFAPAFLTLAFCVVFDVWLGRPAARRHPELTALAIGLSATGPLVLFVHAYGATPDAPALVVAPATVLFTALLSSGPAAWIVLGCNVVMLIWVGTSEPLSLVQSRLLGDLGLIFVVTVIALRCVFALRQRYVKALQAQGDALLEALRQRRRLAGTLFHDASNHLQTLLFLVDEGADAKASGESAAIENAPFALTIGARVQRLIAASKQLLLTSEPPPPASTESVSTSEAVAALLEVYGPRLTAKRLRLDTTGVVDMPVHAPRDLLVESVLGNLLSNAIKFSPAGSVVSLRAEEVGERVRLAVIDSGPGVPADVAACLANEGAVPSRPGTDGERGQGYGLQLVIEHLDRIGGQLELGVAANGGTEAVVWLPRAPLPPR
ncbi:MAG TPA: ATP-binding protein, partial [Polyangiaceae bacterium]|nr:ATP-binding protein [Polyangiaceae bacterium]